MAAALALDAAGFTPYMRLLVHDECIFSFPEDRAEELAAKAAEIMNFSKRGMYVPVDIEMGKRSWGSVTEAKRSK